MKTKDFDYYLPEELIAQTPLEKRDESRLMCLDKETGELSHHHFYELPDFLNPGDCLILNNSRVLPARLLGQRLPGGGACEVLLLIDRGDKTWECIVRPGKHLRKGTKMQFGNGELKAEVVDVLPDGNRMVKLEPRPGSEVTATYPPWLAITCLTIESPRPVPPVARDRALSTR